MHFVPNASLALELRTINQMIFKTLEYNIQLFLNCICKNSPLLKWGSNHFILSIDKRLTTELCEKKP